MSKNVRDILTEVMKKGVQEEVFPEELYKAQMEFTDKYQHLYSPVVKGGINYIGTYAGRKDKGAGLFVYVISSKDVLEQLPDLFMNLKVYKEIVGEIF